MPGYKKYQIQLMDHRTRDNIVAAGGVCFVAQFGLTSKRVIYSDKDGTLATNPVALVNGRVEFWMLDTITDGADLYILAPGGQFVTVAGLKQLDTNEVYVDLGQLSQTYKIPFHIDDTTATTETDTGFDLPNNAMVMPDGTCVQTTILDAGEDIDVGLLASETLGDADGFMDALSVAALGVVVPQIGFSTDANTTWRDLTGGDEEDTFGVLLQAVGTKIALSEGADVATDTGIYFKVPHVGDGIAESIVYTLSAGTNLAAGFIRLQVLLA